MVKKIIIKVFVKNEINKLNNDELNKECKRLEEEYLFKKVNWGKTRKEVEKKIIDIIYEETIKDLEK